MIKARPMTQFLAKEKAAEMATKLKKRCYAFYSNIDKEWKWVTEGCNDSIGPMNWVQFEDALYITVHEPRNI